MYRVGHSEEKKKEWAGQGGMSQEQRGVVLYFEERPFTSVCLVLVLHTAAQIDEDRLFE